jgi:hypothetical protein
LSSSPSGFSTFQRSLMTFWCARAPRRRGVPPPATPSAPIAGAAGAAAVRRPSSVMRARWFCGRYASVTAREPPSGAPNVARYWT